MSKSMIIIDTPSCCEECALNNSFNSEPIKWCGYTHSGRPTYLKNQKPDWCPLQPAPEKKAAMMYLDDESYYFRRGWNACVESLEPNKNKV